MQGHYLQQRDLHPAEERTAQKLFQGLLSSPPCLLQTVVLHCACTQWVLSELIQRIWNLIDPN